MLIHMEQGAIFACGLTDATATLSSLASLNPEWFTFLVPANPGYPGKRGC